MILPLDKALIKLPAELAVQGRALLRRSLLEVKGTDAPRFLQGLSTNDVLDMRRPGQGQYTAFLNPQGRMLFDGFVWRLSEYDFIVDADARIGDALFYHLKQYQLRSKIEVEDVSKHWHVRVGWNDPETTKVDVPFRHVDERAGLNLDRDLISMGIKEDVNESLYKTLRFAFGVPEGPKEIPRTQAIPLEYNVDWLGGISYTKGCYLGQELVARTHHRGVVRKRIMPVVIGKDTEVFSQDVNYSEAVESDIVPEGGTEKDRIGTVISAHGNLGMALVRLEAWKPEASYHTATATRPPIRPLVPHWWPSTTV